MIQVHVFPKDFQPRGSRYVVSLHMSGRDIRRCLCMTVALVGLFSIVHQEWGLRSVFAAFSFSVLIFLACQIRRMSTVHIPEQDVVVLRQGIEQGGAMVVGTSIASVVPVRDDMQ